MVLYDIATHLLTNVFDALTECYPSECEPLAAYVTLGNGDDGIKDSLTVSIASVVGSNNTRPGGLGLWRSTFNVILRESGWPTARVDGETIVLPSPSEQAAAARPVFAMGEAMHRRLAYMMTHRGLVPGACSSATLGLLTPLNPQGGVVGWSVPVVADLPWN